MATFGSFPGVQVTTVSGGVSGVAVGEEENLVIFGEALYQDDAGGDDQSDSLASGVGSSVETPTQINTRREADDQFGSDSELANAMRDALANGANIDFLYGVIVDRKEATDEAITGTSGSTGTLDHAPLAEDTSVISFDNSLTVEFRYDGAPATDGGYSTAPDNTIFINPLTGEYAVTSGTVTTAPTTITYKYLDWDSAFTASAVRNTVDEDETGIYAILSDADTVTENLETEVSDLRGNYQLVNGLSVAEPNDSEVFEDSSTRAGADARYDTATYEDPQTRLSFTEDYMYQFAPGRKENSQETIMGAVGGLFAGNALENPIYNDELANIDSLEQTFSKTDADNMREGGATPYNNVIPVRDTGTIRVKGNRSTNFAEDDAIAADFFTRRVTDRVILIGKTVGDQVIGRINDEDTRAAAARLIRAEMRDLVERRLLRANTGDTTNWTVDVAPDSSNDEQVNIDIAFTPYGIVKQVEETITVNTN